MVKKINPSIIELEDFYNGSKNILTQQVYLHSQESMLIWPAPNWRALLDSLKISNLKQLPCDFSVLNEGILNEKDSSIPKLFTHIHFVKVNQSSQIENNETGVSAHECLIVAEYLDKICIFIPRSIYEELLKEGRVQCYQNYFALSKEQLPTKSSTDNLKEFLQREMKSLLSSYKREPSEEFYIKISRAAHEAPEPLRSVIYLAICSSVNENCCNFDELDKDVLSEIRALYPMNSDLGLFQALVYSTWMKAVAEDCINKALIRWRIYLQEAEKLSQRSDSRTDVLAFNRINWGGDTKQAQLEFEDLRKILKKIEEKPEEIPGFLKIYSEIQENQRNNAEQRIDLFYTLLASIFGVEQPSKENKEEKYFFNIEDSLLSILEN